MVLAEGAGDVDTCRAPLRMHPRSIHARACDVTDRADAIECHDDDDGEVSRPAAVTGRNVPQWSAASSAAMERRTHCRAERIMLMI